MITRFSLFCNVWMLAAGLLILAPVAGHADSLWRTESSQPMTADKKAHAIGDIVTILVQETSTATKNNTTKTSKDSEIDASITSFLYSPAASGLLRQRGQMPALKTKGTTSFNGGGTINNAENIVAKIAVQVVEVLPNRNLIIEGRRQTSFSGESQDVVLRGTVRPDDISANNTLYSYNVANATVTFVNKGAVSTNQKKGWFGKFWELIDPF